MKFSHVLKFNSVPDWRDFYLDYSKLKRLSYAIEKQEEEERQRDAERRHSLDLAAAAVGGGSREWRDPLLDEGRRASGDGGDVSQHHFQRCLDAELSKIVEFYIRKEAELAREYEALQMQARATEAPHLPSLSTLEPDVASTARISFWRSQRGSEHAALLRSKLADLHMQLFDLCQFVEMNRTGFRKTLKKHDKLTNVSLMSEYMPLVEAKLSEKRCHDVEERIEDVTSIHALVANEGDFHASQIQLKQNLRDKVEFERGTVWRDMVALERSRVNAKVESADVAEAQSFFRRHARVFVIAFALAVFFVMLNVDVIKDTSKRHCAAMFVLLVILWVSEALPLYVTSMLAPLLTVVLRIFPDGEGGQMPAPDVANRVFQIMFSQVIMLLLGGFAIAGALSKHYIAKVLATNILSRVGTKPHNVILANMFVATFASMWISNVAAPVLCFSLIQPILRTQPSHHPLSKSLVMGIALASNVGGMTSPISSPQNIFAIDLMAADGEPPNWLYWFIVALPVSVVSNVAIWLVLLAVYQPGRAIREVKPLRSVSDGINATQVVVLTVSVATVLLWCCNTALSQYLGDQGIIAILPLVVFFGCGILQKDDFNSFLWHVVMLAQGGLVLGQAVKESGILADVASAISDATVHYSVWSMTAVFCALVLACTTMISHTVGAMVILPILQSVGESLPVPHPRLLVMAGALMCSGAMGLPVSGFPNMNAVSLEDATGKTYVNTVDFLKVGLLSSVVVWGIIVSLAYGIMMAVGY